MIAVYVQTDDGLAPHGTFAVGTDLAIGSDPACAIRLAGEGVRARHCTLQVRAAGCFVVDTCGETLVNGRAIAGPRALYREDVVTIGARELIVDRLAGTLDPIEASLLLAIRGGDHASREVYADWLDEHGDPRRAELLRVQERTLAPDSPADERAACTRRVRELAVVIDHDWRIAVARGRVERCDAACTMDWGSLAETSHPLQRRCLQCRNLVSYCEAVPTDAAGGRTRRVVIDATVRRTPGDLE